MYLDTCQSQDNAPTDDHEAVASREELPLRERQVQRRVGMTASETSDGG